jgi:hypothetical protein
MPEVNVVKNTPSNDFSPKLKFVVSVGAQVIIGLLGIAVTAAVTVALAKGTETAIELAE